MADQCQYGAAAKNGKAIMKPTKFMTNSPEIAAALSIGANLAGAASLSIAAYAPRGPSGAAFTRRYHTTIPRSWFSAASASGSTASVSVSLTGSVVQLADFVVYGMPSWFDRSLPSAGIAAYMTADAAGTTPAQVRVIKV